MIKEVLAFIDYYEKSRGISRDKISQCLLKVLRQVVTKVYNVTNPESINIDFRPDDNICDVTLNGELVHFEEMGRIGAHLMRQTLNQAIQEEEAKVLYEKVLAKVGHIVTGTINRIHQGNVYVTINDVEAILPPRETVDLDNYILYKPIKVYVKSVDKSGSQIKIIISRACKEFVFNLMKEEIPELYDETIKIVSIARRPGIRTKVSVATDSSLDPVGTCVGIGGKRINAVKDEIHREKIDIIPVTNDPEEMIRNALSPAKVGSITLNQEDKSAIVNVDSDNYSTAIGRKGSNVYLAIQITGWNINLVPIEQNRDKPNISSIFKSNDEIQETQNLMDKTQGLREFLNANLEDIQKLVDQDCTTQDELLSLDAEARSQWLDSLPEDKANEFLDIIQKSL